MQESAYEGETNDDEVVGNIINISKSYNIDFQIGFAI